MTACVVLLLGQDPAALGKSKIKYTPIPSFIEPKLLEHVFRTQQPFCTPGCFVAPQGSRVVVHAVGRLKTTLTEFVVELPGVSRVERYPINGRTGSLPPDVKNALEHINLFWTADTPLHVEKIAKKFKDGGNIEAAHRLADVNALVGASANNAAIIVVLKNGEALQTWELDAKTLRLLHKREELGPMVHVSAPQDRLLVPIFSIGQVSKGKAYFNVLQDNGLVFSGLTTGPEKNSLLEGVYRTALAPGEPERIFRKRNLELTLYDPDSGKFRPDPLVGAFARQVFLPMMFRLDAAIDSYKIMKNQALSDMAQAAKGLH